MKALPPFARLVAAAMEGRGLGLRELCRRADVDPSLLSKVLAGKRNPPSDDRTLGRMAEALGLDAAELAVAAGRLPAGWEALQADPELLGRVAAMVTRTRLMPRAPSPARPAPRAEPERPRTFMLPPRPALSEELL